jgi:trimeric autotransporter adhesin
MRESTFAIIGLLLWMSSVKPSPAQSYLISTVAGGGTPNHEPALSVGIGEPYGIARDADGNIYVAAKFPASEVFKIDATGNLTYVAGNGISGYSGDGGLATKAAVVPSDVAVDVSGNIFIADGSNRIREVVAATGIIQTVAGNGTAGYSGDGGAATQAELNQVTGVSVDSAGNIFIADGGNDRIREVRVATGIIQTVAGNGVNGYSGDGGKATQANLNLDYILASGVFVHGSDNIFIADTHNHVIRKVAALTGIIQTVAGIGLQGYSGDGGKATEARLNYPEGVFVDDVGNMFIADTENDRIREINAATGIIATVAGNGTYGYSGDGGPATQANFRNPARVTVDGTDDIFIADLSNDVIREVAANTGIIQTVIGNGFANYSGDGGPATQAQLSSPSGVYVNGLGNIFIADSFVIREVTAATGIIQTVAGPGATGVLGDGGPATQAEFDDAAAVSVDASGNIFISDRGNALPSVGSRIREVSAVTGIIETVAGTGTVGYSGDGGPATQADLAAPCGVFVDHAGDIFIADFGFDANSQPPYDFTGSAIRGVDAATGLIQTVAGNGTPGYSGNGGVATQAELYGPSAVVVDGSGNVFIADEENNVVREVFASTGIIQTVAGNGKAGYSGDGGKATLQSLVPRPDWR